MDKRGQFFLFAALVAVGALFGLTAIVNYAQKTPQQDAFYDLSEEIGFETKQVIDYGVYRGENTDELVLGILQNYSGYISPGEAIFFYGNATNISAFYIMEGQANVGVSFGALPLHIPVNFPGRPGQNHYTGNNINITLNNITYNFDLEPGENFYFILTRREGNERFVAAR